MKQPLPDGALANHIAIIGKTGSGKTTTAKLIAEFLLASQKRICAIDPTGVWWGLKSRKDGKAGAYPIVVFGGEHAYFPIGKNHGSAIAEIVATSDASTVIDTSLFTVGERTQFFTDFAEALLRKNRLPLHLMIDEAHNFAPQARVPDPQSGRMLHATNNLVSMGRSRGLKIILITQRPAKLHKDSLTQVETLIAMRLMAPQDRRAVEEWIGEWADPKEGKEILQSLPSLKTGQGWIWSPEINMLKREDFPNISTYDSSSAPTGKGGKVVLADIDMAAIAEKLESTALEVFSDDPKRLRARIAELEKDLAHKGASPDKLQEAKEQGKAEGWAQAMSAVAEFARQPSLAGAPVQKIVPKPPPKMLVQKAKKARTAQTLAKDDEIPGGEKKILIVLAQYLNGCTREQLTVMTGYKRSSRDAYLQRLKSKGYSTGSGDQLMATAEGIAALGDDYEPLPTGAALRQHWLDRLPKGERDILDFLMQFYPDTVSRDAISEAIDYKRSSRDAYLQRLISRQLVKKVDGGVQAIDGLFL